MIAPWAFLLVAVLPCFWLLAHMRTGAVLIGASAMLQIPLSLSAASALVSITESLPRRWRSGAVAMLYAVAIATFGGTTSVDHHLADPDDPATRWRRAWYMTAPVACPIRMTLSANSAGRPSE